MRGALAKTIRRQADQARNQAIGALGPAVEAALGNEELTRQRVERLEKRLAEVEGVLRHGFRARLRWLISGK